MRPRIQLRFVGEQMKYLEEQMQLMEPVIGLMKNALDKSKTWIEDKNDNPSITYIEICHELASATTALLDVASNILSENKEPVDVDDSKPSLSPSRLQPTATDKHDHSESTNHMTKRNLEEVFTRLGLLENSLFCLQNTTRKTQEDMSEIKQWRDNFVTEQSDIGAIIEQLTKKQQNFKNLRKQMSEQDNKVKEMNREIESLKEKESKSNKSLDKLSLDMKGYENNVHKINKDMQDHADKTNSLTQEIKRLSDLIVSLQEDHNKIVVNTSTGFEKLQSKHSVMHKLLEQRMMPIDKLIQIFNQNLETREEKIKKLGELENTFSKLSNDFHLIESRVGHRYACHLTLNLTPFSTELIISRFCKVREYNGQHFNKTTGKFVSPHDGLYLVCVSLHEWENKQIRVGVVAGGRGCTAIEVKCADTSAAGSVVVDMKKGQELYFQVLKADQDAKLSCYNSFTIVGL